VAFARDRSTFTDLAGNGASSAFTRTGWIAGIGLEYGITESGLAKIEYDYLSFGTQLLNFTTATPTAYASITTFERAGGQSGHQLALRLAAIAGAAIADRLGPETDRRPRTPAREPH
jgi:hypothetical protein